MKSTVFVLGKWIVPKDNPPKSQQMTRVGRSVRSRGLQWHSDGKTKEREKTPEKMFENISPMRTYVCICALCYIYVFVPGVA